MELRPFTRNHFKTLAFWFPTEADLIQWGGSKLRYPLDDAQLNMIMMSILRSKYELLKKAVG
jgi:hypothetical protein